MQLLGLFLNGILGRSEPRTRLVLVGYSKLRSNSCSISSPSTYADGLTGHGVPRALEYSFSDASGMVLAGRLLRHSLRMRFAGGAAEIVRPDFDSEIALKGLTRVLLFPILARLS